MEYAVSTPVDEATPALTELGSYRKGPNKDHHEDSRVLLLYYSQASLVLMHEVKSYLTVSGLMDASWSFAFVFSIPSSI